MAEEPTAAPPVPLDEQVEWWMEKYFKLQDEYVEAINALAQIRVIVGANPTAQYDGSEGSQ